MSDAFTRPTPGPAARPSVTDQVFDPLHDRIIELDLPPGTRLSEIEVAKQFGVSRQPVRDAFHRLSKLGFLSIRPQRATSVSQISGRGDAGPLHPIRHRIVAMGECMIEMAPPPRAPLPWALPAIR